MSLLKRAFCANGDHHALHPSLQNRSNGPLPGHHCNLRRLRHRTAAVHQPYLGLAVIRSVAFAFVLTMAILIIVAEIQRLDAETEIGESHQAATLQRGGAR